MLDCIFSVLLFLFILPIVEVMFSELTQFIPFERNTPRTPLQNITRSPEKLDIASI